jgi:hypothetical protein
MDIESDEFWDCSKSIMDRIEAELLQREQQQRDFHGKHDDERGAFALWLITEFDRRSGS